MVTVHPNMQAQEDLAALFSKNLILEPVQTPKNEPKIVYVSQHYNHSAHAAAQPQPSPRPASEPPQAEHTAVEAVLRDNGVDPTVLSVSQLQLFKTSEEHQQLRLIELWRAAPPTNSNDNPTLAWSFTTLEQEETLSRMRYEMRQRAQMSGVSLSLDGTPLTPIQTGDGRWIATQNQHYMEPYMASGYEEMARREYEDSVRKAYLSEATMDSGSAKPAYQPLGTAVGAPDYNRATDPVYNNTNMAGSSSSGTSGIDWALQAQMENQYGRMMQLREDDEEML
jgi:hypothetical protein